MKCKTAECADNLVRHKPIRQRLNLRHGRRRNNVILPVYNLKLIRKFLM